MKVERVSSIAPVESSTNGVKNKTINSFSNIIKTLQRNLDQQIDLPKIQPFQGQIKQATELINTQIKANNYLLNVELVSKVAESASSTLKKLQNAQ